MRITARLFHGESVVMGSVWMNAHIEEFGQLLERCHNREDDMKEVEDEQSPKVHSTCSP